MVDVFMSTVQAGVEWVLYLLVATSLVSVALFIERLWHYRLASVKVAPLEERILDVLSHGKDRRALAEELSKSRSVAARTAAVAIDAMGRTPEAAREVVEAHLLQERRRLERGLTFLGTVGSNAPFVGLFGTVLGIVKAFADLAHTRTAGPQVVMAGISEALVATAVGLAVAIPAVVAFNYFKTRVKAILADAEVLVRLVSSYHLDEFLGEHAVWGHEGDGTAKARHGAEQAHSETEEDGKDVQLQKVVALTGKGKDGPRAVTVRPEA